MTRTGLSRWPIIADAFEIYGLLSNLGITENYKGFWQSAYAVYLAMKNPCRLALVSKWLYPDVAKRCHTTWSAVERNIRTTAGLAWARNPALLCELAGCAIPSRPKAGQFVSILAFHLLNIRSSE